MIEKLYDIKTETVMTDTNYTATPKRRTVSETVKGANEEELKSFLIEYLDLAFNVEDGVRVPYAPTVDDMKRLFGAAIPGIDSEFFEKQAAVKRDRFAVYEKIVEWTESGGGFCQQTFDVIEPGPDCSEKIELNAYLI